MVATAWIDQITGVEGSIGYIFIVLVFYAGYQIMQPHGSSSSKVTTTGGPEKEEEDEPDPPRNFTAAQLLKFDGKGDDTPLYLSVHGIVFDVSTAKDFYGPGGPYELFAGRECGVALAKMSFEECHLDDVGGCATLNAGEKYELENWIEKFRDYRNYPVLGKLVPRDKLPDSERVLSREELAKYDGKQDDIPPGYATAPIYLGVSGQVFDVSFGGVTFYGEGCSYHKFAGRDASRALAKMSFDPCDIDSWDTSDLTEKELKVMEDWRSKYETDKLYPIVGRLE